MKKTILLFIALISLSPINNIIAQDSSTKGTDFWFGFMNNLTYSPVGGPFYTYISSERATSGTISIPELAWSQNFNISSNSTIRITMPPSVEPFNFESIYDKAVHVISCDSITVYAHNAVSLSSDATVIYPTAALQDEYMVLNYNEPGYTFYRDQILIVATQDSTEIQITPTATTSGGHQAGVPFNITLNQGQTYQVLNAIDTISLTGTTIIGINSSKRLPFAVYSGHKCTYIGGCSACDHLYEQLLPLSALGTRYILPPLKNKSTTIYQVMATQNATSVSVNGGAPISLNTGQTYQFDNNIPSFVSSDNPIMIMQYAQGYDCDSVGDPFQILMFPQEQSINNISFNAFVTPIINEYWVNVVVKTADVVNTILDGVNIASSFSPVPSNTTFSYAQVNISSGNHTLKNPGGLLAYIYGWGAAESFGYCAGASLKDLKNDFTITPNPTCIGSTVNFATISDSISTAYEWDFGDTSATSFGLNTAHAYSYDGVYEVKLTKYRANGYDIVVKKNVYIISPSVKINQSDTTICAGTELQLSADIVMDSLEIIKINNCGDTTISYQTSYFDSITWSTGDTGLVITILPTSSMMVYVYGHKTDEVCSTIDSIMINVVEEPSFTLNDFCEGAENSANVTGSTDGDFNIVSPLGDGATIDVITGEIFNGIGGTTYTIGYQSSGFCSSIVTEQVTVFPAVTVSFIADPLLGEPPLEVKFNQYSSNVDNLIWDFGDGETLQSMNSVVFHNFMNVGVYTTILLGTDNNGCSDSANVKITVAYMGASFPNVFTPNGDGDNDFFKLVNYQGISKLNIVVLNRWGNLVFESDKIDFNWDGKVQKTGVNCIDGTYFFKATITVENGEQRTEHGYIHLHRGK